MSSRRVGTALLAVLLVTSGLTAVATPATAGTILTVDAEATPDPAPPGTNVTVSTTLEGVGGDDAYRLQRVTLRKGPDANSTQLDRAYPRDLVGPDGRRTVDLHQTFERSGEYTRYVHVRLTTPDGDLARIVRSVNVTVEQTHPAMAMDVDDVTDDGRANYTVTLANGLPSEVRGLTLDLSTDSARLLEERHVVASMAPGSATSVTVPARDVDPGRQTVTATLTYLTAAGESRSVTRTLAATAEAEDDDDDPERAPAVDLTGLRVSHAGGDLVIRGSASNLGESNATGVVVAVQDDGPVSPARNQSTYFVGAVDGSDYASFEVHASVAEGVNRTVAVPIQVSYVDDDERVTETTTVSYTPPADTESESGGGPPLVGLGVGGLAVLLVGGVVLRRVR